MLLYCPPKQNYLKHIAAITFLSAFIVSSLISHAYSKDFRAGVFCRPSKIPWQVAMKKGLETEAARISRNMASSVIPGLLSPGRVRR